MSRESCWKVIGTGIGTDLIENSAWAVRTSDFHVQSYCRRLCIELYYHRRFITYFFCEEHSMAKNIHKTLHYQTGITGAYCIGGQCSAFDVAHSAQTQTGYSAQLSRTYFDKHEIRMRSHTRLWGLNLMPVVRTGANWLKDPYRLTPFFVDRHEHGCTYAQRVPNQSIETPVKFSTR